MDKSLVSIIMATYNRAQFIVASLKSIQVQTYSNWECIIIDDGGTDNTSEVIAPFLDDKRFKFFKRPKEYTKGLSGSRNYGLDLVSGEYIIFFDDDDIVHPQNLEICTTLLHKNATANFCQYGKQAFIDRKEIKTFDDLNVNTINISITDETVISKMIQGHIGFASCTVLWRAKCFESIRFKEQLLYAEEWECYTRLLSKYHKGIIIKELLYFNRKHENSNTGLFYKGNTKQVNSKIEACKHIVMHLARNNQLTDELKNFFVWKSVLFKDKNLLNLLIKELNLPTLEKLKLKLKYNLSAFIKVYLKLKKKIV